MDNISSLTVVKNAYNENVTTPSQIVATIRNNLSHGVREHYEDGFPILVNYLEGAVGVVPEKLRTLDRGRPWRDSQFASTRLSPSRDMSR